MISSGCLCPSRGGGLFEATVDVRTRFRPILMTSLAFIFKVCRLVIASGVGAVNRQSVGTAVFAEILGVTALGIFFTPALYVFMQGRKKLDSRKSCEN